MTKKRDRSTAEESQTIVESKASNNHDSAPMPTTAPQPVSPTAPKQPIPSSHDVHDMDSPYLGLRSFTYANRARYTGRAQEIEQARSWLTHPDKPRSILMVAGASGSGKSSFIQAGVLPALEKHYTNNAITPRIAVFRPSLYPFDSLANALRQLDIPASMLNLEAIYNRPEKLSLFIAHTTTKTQVNILVIDQFDELFTLAEPGQRDLLLNFLEALPPFAETRTHIIIPIRTDYLPRLFAYKAIFEATRTAIDLREMSADELRLTIQHPIQQIYPQSGKQLDDNLTESLIGEALQDASRLPMLQAALEIIWRRGSLTAESYIPLDIAIEQYAEDVYRYVDYQQTRILERSTADRELILQVFFALMCEVNQNNAGDVRLRRTVTELYQRIQPPVLHTDLSRIIEELCAARLLTKSVDIRNNTSVEMIEIIHEVLVRHWSRLQRAQPAYSQRKQQAEPSEQQHITNHTPLPPQTPDQEEHMQRDTPPHPPMPLAVGETKRRVHPEPTGSSAQQRLAALVKRGRNQIRHQRIRTMLIMAIVLIFMTIVAYSLYQNNHQWQGVPASPVSENHTQAPTDGGQIGSTLGEHGTPASSGQDSATSAPRQTAEAAQQTTEALQQATENQAQSLRAQELLLKANTLMQDSPEVGLLIALEAAKIAQNPAVEAVLHQALLKVHLRVNLRGHREGVWDAAYSPNGLQIVTSSDDQTARVWDAITGAEILVLRGHEAAVWNVAYSPNGQRIVTASEDGTARVWNVTSGEQQLVLTEPEARMSSAVFSPDGQEIVTSSDSGPTRIWNATTGEEKRVLRGGEGARRVACSPDGERIVTANYDQRVRIWNRETGSLYTTLYGHDDVVWSAAYSPNSERIVTTSADETVRIWDARSGREELLIEGVSARNAQFSPDGQRIVTSGWDTTVRVWDATNGKDLLLLQGHTAAVNAAVFSPDGQRLVSTSADTRVRVWDAGSGAERLVLASHEDAVIRAVFDIESKRIATASADKTVRVWSSETGQQLFVLDGHQEAVTSVAFSPDGQLIVTAGKDKTARVWSTTNAIEQRVYDRHEATVWQAAFSPDGQLIVTASADKTARVWQVASGKELLILQGHAGDVHSAAFSSDGSRIVTASGDGTVRVWSADNGKEEAVLRRHTGNVNSAMFSLDGKRIVSAGGDALAYVWDVATGDVLLILRGHEGSLHSASFSPDGNRIVTSGSDSTTRLWDAHTGEQLFILPGHTAAVNSAVYSPDRQAIVTASDDGTARVYYATFDGVLDQAKRAVTRSLTNEERRMYMGE